jgi:hypothetical protein
LERVPVRDIHYILNALFPSLKSYVSFLKAHAPSGASMVSSSLLVECYYLLIHATHFF